MYTYIGAGEVVSNFIHSPYAHDLFTRAYKLERGPSWLRHQHQ